jgi:hypothetical protein
MPDSIPGVAGEDQAGRTPPAADAATPALAQQQTTTPQERPSAQPTAEQPAPSQEPGPPPPPSKPGFGERGRMRRRARFLRKARELAYRDLGGLVYDLHRFGQRNDQVVLAKLATLGHIDAELRALEQALHEIRPVTVLREVGIAACPRCAAIHGNEDRFCPGCGLPFAAGAERPLSTAPVTPPQPGAGTDPAAASASTSTAAAPLGLARPVTPAPAGPAATTPPARPAGEPLTTIERPPAPALKPTAAPVAARPQLHPGAAERKDGEREDREREGDPTREGGQRHDGTREGGELQAGTREGGQRHDGTRENGELQVGTREDGQREPEDEPTQVLRPPAAGA